MVAAPRWDTAPLKFEFRPYRRIFQRSLSTSHGEWRDREGIIIRLTQASGRVGWGEVAPVPWFGSETLADAIAFCRQLPPFLTATTIDAIANQLPACQFGFESALEMVQPMAIAPFPHHFPPCSALLPAGENALAALFPLIQQGFTTFKWKIGVEPLTTELEQIFPRLIATLPPTSQLRLDANGGLTVDQAIRWLDCCDTINQQANQQPCCRVEFLEQPLSPEHFSEMVCLADHYLTLIALDESVVSLEQLQNCYTEGWRDVFVIKPAIAGSPSRLRQFCQGVKVDVVVSSVFETAIGQQAVRTLAQTISTGDRALGMGLDHWFADDDPLRCQDAEALWNLL